jgi:hypothetical protein
MKKRSDRISGELRPEYSATRPARIWSCWTLKSGKRFQSERAVNQALRLVIELRKIGSARGRSD